MKSRGILNGFAGTSSAGLQLGRFQGIPFSIHISLVILVGYLIFLVPARFSSLAQSVGIPATQLSGIPLFWGLGIGLTYFASIFLREYAQILLARPLGLRPREVQLMLLGGRILFEPNDRTRSPELKLALFGPFFSYTIAFLTWMGATITSIPNLVFFLFWTSAFNLMIGTLNLLPAFPLDEGRALRTYLSMRYAKKYAQKYEVKSPVNQNSPESDSRVRATKLTVKTSLGIAFALGILGLLSFNLLLIFLAFFIYTSSQSELFYLMSRGLLQGMSVGEITIRTRIVRENEPLDKAADQMLESRQTTLPVITEDGTPRLIRLSQVRRVPRDFWHITLVKDVMEKVRRTLEVQDPVADALADLTGGRLGALPVTENNQLIGIARYRDVAELMQLQSLGEEDTHKAA